MPAPQSLFTIGGFKQHTSAPSNYVAPRSLFTIGGYRPQQAAAPFNRAAPGSLFTRPAGYRPQATAPVVAPFCRPDGSAIAAWHGPRIAQALTPGGLANLIRGDVEHAFYTVTHPLEHAAGHFNAALGAFREGRFLDAAALATGNAAIHGKKF